MAENKNKGAQHLTSLDLDISGILSSLEEAKAQIEQYSLETGQIFRKNITETVTQSANDIKNASANFDFSKILDSNDIEKVKESLEELAKTYGDFAKSSITSSEKGLFGSITYDDSFGTTITKQFKLVEDGWEETSTKVINNAQKMAQEQIKAQERAKRAQEKELERQKRYGNQITDLTHKTEKFISTVSEQKGGFINRQLINDADDLLRKINELNDAYDKNGSLTPEQAKLLEDYQSKLKELGYTFDTAGAKGQSFLQAIADKARWLSAFYLVNQFQTIFRDTIETIKTTEDAVVNLQRVLGTDISQSAISEELYQIAGDYGRTFDEVSDVSSKFAQAGYEWNEVIELTRGTMLALNTAELDVSQSTKDLIAILQQWGLEADDYAEVIDKINITGDNFAVTSENIVAALQRASSSAKTANISLEETIGIITAMAEATGRSGENIGTALNSLIIYTQKAESLKVFASLSDQMSKLISKFQSGSVSIYDVWKGLASEIESLSNEQQEALLKMTDYEEFADELESQATEYTSQIRSIYGTAGTYRQNYFIALLNDMATAQEAIDNMTESQGYSAKENNRYMESLTAQYNQLKIALQELAVQAGEAGLLNWLKWFTQIGISAATTTKNLGGMVNVLNAVGSAYLILQQKKVAKTFIDIHSAVKVGIDGLKNFTTALYGVATAEDKVAAASALLGSSLGWVGAIGLAVSTLVGAFNMYSNSLEEARLKSLQNAETHKSEADNIKSLISEYETIIKFTGEASEKERMLADYKKELIEQYGFEKEAVEALNGARRQEIDFLDEEYASKIRSAYLDIKDQYTEAVKQMENASKGINVGDALLINKDDINILKEYLNIYDTVDEYGNSTGRTIEFNTSNLQEQVDILTEILTNTELNYDTELALQNVLDSKKRRLEEISDVYKNYSETVAQEYLLQDRIQDKIKQISLLETDEARKKEYDDLVELIKREVVGLEAQAAAMEVLNGLFPEFSENVDDSSDKFNDFNFNAGESTNVIASLVGSLQETSSALDTLYSALDEVNTNGSLSISTVQSLIEANSSYANILEVTKNGIAINKQKLDELVDAELEELKTTVTLEYAKDAVAKINELLAESEEKAKSSAHEATEQFKQQSEDLVVLAQQAILGATSVDALVDSYEKAKGKRIDTDTASKINDILIESRENANNLINSLYDVYGSFDSFKRNSSSSSESAMDDELKAQKQQLDNQKDYYNQQIKAIKEITSTTKEELKKQQTAIKESYDKEIDILERRKEAVQQSYDEQIAAVESMQEAQERYEKYEEYLKNKKDAEKNIAKSASRSGAEYREQEMEARESLEEIEQEWQKQQMDWATEDMVSWLESLRDAELAALDRQIEQKQNERDSKVKEKELQIEKIEEVQDAEIDKLQKLIEELDIKVAELSGEVVTSNAEIMQGMYDTYYKEYIEPIVAETPQRFDETFEQVATNSKNVWIQMYSDFKTEFYDKVQSMLTEVQSFTPQLSMPASEFLHQGVGAYAVNNNTTNYNNNRNAVIYNSILGNNNADSVNRSIFTIP